MIRIVISVVIKNTDLVISVSDDGCGFRNSDIGKATLPFYKLSKDISTEHLGLGLNICKILCERQGWKIQIANNKSGGACVTVKINCSESWLKIDILLLRYFQKKGDKDKWKK